MTALAEPPTAVRPAVHGELTVDETQIAVMVAGDAAAAETAARRMETLTPLIKASDPPGALLMPTTWGAVVQLAATFGHQWRAGPRLQAWAVRELHARMGELPTDPAALTTAPPAGLTPRGYQVQGAVMFGALGSALLFDDQGTGKTITAILGLVQRAAAGHRVTPVVVVAPNAVVDSWVEHVHRWAPGWRAVAWRGSPGRRKRLAGTADVYVTTYGTARSDAADADARRNPLVALGAVTVVADEVHKIKDQTSKQSRAVRRLAGKAAGFMALSGTPITHHPGDLWPALYCLDPAAWPSRERWVDRYCETAPGDYSLQVLGLDPLREPEFRDTIRGQYRRVAKADVLTELPPKVYSVRRVEIPARWRAAYDAMESDMLAQLPDSDGETELSAMGVLAQLTRLAQLASAAADVHTTTETVIDPETGLEMTREHQHVTLKAPSWKIDELLEILAERPGAQTAVYAPSAQLIRLAGAAAAKAGYRVGYVIGGQTATARTADVDAFQAGDLDVICVTTGAGGVGLTLTAASAAVFLQRPWSLVEALQAEDRQHRIGSEIHTSVEIIDVLTVNTVEARVREVLAQRAEALSDLVVDPRIVAELLGGSSLRAASS